MEVFIWRTDRVGYWKATILAAFACVFSCVHVRWHQNIGGWERLYQDQHRSLHIQMQQHYVSPLSLSKPLRWLYQGLLPPLCVCMYMCVCVWNSWMKRLMLHCQMSQVVYLSGEINCLSFKQQVVDRSRSIWWESDNLRRQFLLCFGFSHYDLDSTLMMNVSLCRILF